MNKYTLFAVGGSVIIAVLVAEVFFRPRTPINENCSVQALAEQISPDGMLVAKYERGVCDDGKTVLHTIGIAPVDRDRNQKVISAVVHKAQSDEATEKDAMIDLKLKFRWLDSDTLELTHPDHVQISQSLILSGVKVIGRKDK